MKERITIAFDVDLDYDTLRGRTAVLKAAKRDLNPHVMAWYPENGKAELKSIPDSFREAVAVPVDLFREFVKTYQDVFDDVRAYGASDADAGYQKTLSLAESFLPPKPNPNP